MDEINLDELEKDITNKNAVEERMRKLHADKKLAEESAAAAQKAKEETDAKLAQMEKDNKFFSGFSDTLSKNPQAAEYKDKIKEKFAAGYSMEDAVITTLHAEGKLSSQPGMKESPIGGSAINNVAGSPQKAVSEMSREDKLAGLRDAEARGDLGLS